MASRPLTGYALTNYFRKLRLRHSFTPLEAYLFFELAACCNDVGWPEEFSVSNALLQGALSCSEQGLINARTSLASAGLLAYVSGNRRTPTLYRFTVSQGSTQFSHSGAGEEVQDSTEFSQSPADGSTKSSTQFSHPEQQLANGSTQGSTEGSTQFSPYKEQTKTKNILLTTGERVSNQVDSKSSTPTPVVEQPTSHPKTEIKPSEGGLDFASFWQAYGNKKGRHKSELKWQALSPAERVAALAAVPAYVARTPNLQFRKHPLSWLNGKHWEDEELAPAIALPTPAATELFAPALNHEVVAERDAQRKAAFRAHLARHAAQAATN